MNIIKTFVRKFLSLINNLIKGKDVLIWLFLGCIVHFPWSSLLWGFGALMVAVVMVAAGETLREVLEEHINKSEV